MALLTSGAFAVPALTLVRLADETPQPEDVKAGWTAFAIFILLALAVAVLGFSLVKQLRKAQAAKDAGLYGDEPVAEETDGPPQAAPQAHGDGTAEAPGDAQPADHPADEPSEERHNPS